LSFRRRIAQAAQGRIVIAEGSGLTSQAPREIQALLQTSIRLARASEYDEVARVWMESWVSTGLAEASNFLLANLRARVRHEIEKGWSLYVADDRGTLAAMLALHLPNHYLDQLFVAPDYQGNGLGRQLLAFTRQQLPDEIWLRCVRENEKAWRWYQREGFLFEKEQVEPMTGFTMKYYRWKKSD
jgi:GNAT superfamily N-acetyltransferase